MKTAITDTEMGLAPQSYHIMMNPPCSPGGPRPGAAYHAGENTAPDALPYILAMARRHEEQEFQQRAAGMTELWEDSKESSRHPTTHPMADHRRVRHGVADKLNAIIMASLGKPRILRAGGMATIGLNFPSTEMSQT